MNKNDISSELYSKLQKYLKKSYLNNAHKVICEFCKIYIREEYKDNMPQNNNDALKMFLNAKRIEGSSERTIKYYNNTLDQVLKNINKLYSIISTDDIRNYLSDYKMKNKVSNVTIDNVRRVVSSFFCWLECEDFIYKSPTKRIHKVKTVKKIKEIYDDETIEILRKGIKNIRNLAIIDILLSTGMRVGELVRLNISDLDLEKRECLVLGKGNKQRKVFFNTQTKLNIIKYLEGRNDNNKALFVSLLKPYERLNISGVEIMLRKLGVELGLKNIYPHKFRRTIATKAIDKGMPIEQVQHMLGHSKIDTTLEYAIVDEENVKNSHKKYLQ